MNSPRCDGCGRVIKRGEMAHGRVGDPRVYCVECGPLPTDLLDRVLRRFGFVRIRRSLGGCTCPRGAVDPSGLCARHGHLTGPGKPGC